MQSPPVEIAAGKQVSERWSDFPDRAWSSGRAPGEKMKTFDPKSRFAMPEWERRFLLHRFPANVSVVRVRQILDRYIVGTRLRLRRISDPDGTAVFKLTQKLSEGATGAFQGLLTTIYLAKAEYDLLAALPARVLEKTRHSVPPLGIDVFNKELTGLFLAEAEFRSAEAATAFEPPSFVAQEVTSDSRFTGASLAAARRQEVIGYLAECGITLDDR